MSNLKIQPLVSIVITSFNRAKFINKAIESALAQDYPNLEIIISDNCSTDDTYSIVSKYFSNSRIKYFQNEENIGMWANFERAYYERAKGDYLVNISSDDYLTNNSFISESINLIAKYQNISIVWGINDSVWTSKKITHNIMPNKHDLEFREGIEVFLDYPQKHTWYGAGACLIDLKKARLMKKVYDIDLNLYLLLHGNACFINKPSYAFILHGSNATNNYEISDYINELKVYEEKFKIAISKFPNKEDKIKIWLDNVLYQKILDILKILVIDKNKFSLFYAIVKDEYPIQTKKAHSNFNLILRKYYNLVKIIIK